MPAERPTRRSRRGRTVTPDSPRTEASQALASLSFRPVQSAPDFANMTGVDGSSSMNENSNGVNYGQQASHERFGDSNFTGGLENTLSLTKLHLANIQHSVHPGQAHHNLHQAQQPYTEAPVCPQLLGQQYQGPQAPEYQQSVPQQSGTHYPSHHLHGFPYPVAAYTPSPYPGAPVQQPVGPQDTPQPIPQHLLPVYYPVYPMPQHKRGPWTQQEDELLKDLVSRMGATNWVRTSAMIGSRSPKQCRERYHQNLKPGLNHSPITEDEGNLIIQLVREKGKRWAEIARHLNGRSDNAVKNWFNGGENRRKRAKNLVNRTADSSNTNSAGSFHHHRMQHHEGPRPDLMAQQSLPQFLPPSQQLPNTIYHPVPQHHDGQARRPSPLHINLHTNGYHVYAPPPIPSPGSHSNASMDTPSLVTDNASTYSPRTPLCPPGTMDRRGSSHLINSHLPAPHEDLFRHASDPSPMLPQEPSHHHHPYGYQPTLAIPPLQGGAPKSNNLTHYGNTSVQLPAMQPSISSPGPIDPLMTGRRSSLFSNGDARAQHPVYHNQELSRTLPEPVSSYNANPAREGEAPAPEGDSNAPSESGSSPGRNERMNINNFLR